tara:strand:+ start:18224 stop:19333 length:1110 start_codon:yes stop_codon:yes gene_type:complete
MERKIICKRCVLDNTIEDIHFNLEGICNYCEEFNQEIQNYTFSDSEIKRNLDNLSKQIQDDGRSKEFNCIMGMSGGVDSSYVAHLAGQLELKPLVVHLDNSWNSETAVRNVNKIVTKLNFQLSTHVINWNEFKDIQKSYFHASVVDLEVPTDHAITAIIYKLASQYGIKHVLSGGNYRTEHGLPKSWRWDKLDYRNLKDIHKRFGSKALKTYPTIGNFSFTVWHRGIKRVKQHLPLNLVNFRRSEATDILKNEYDWTDYGGKHHESIFTKFYQTYVLPKKFSIDKRKAHLSCLIRNEEMSRDKALDELQSPPYSNEDLAIEKPYVLKKLGFDEEEFEKIIEKEQVAHDFFRNEKKLKELINKLKRFKQK